MQYQLEQTLFIFYLFCFLFFLFQADWVDAQFRSTRDAKMSNPFSEWRWGGMQYQLFLTP